MKLWIGEEQEGEFKGTKTLFVGDPSITIKDIEEVNKYQKFTQIYFGAGVCTEINYDVVRNSLLLFPKYIITLEMDYKEFSKVREEFINSRVYFILTITDKGFSRLRTMFKDRVQIKIQSLDILLDKRFLALEKLINFKIVDTSRLIKKTYHGDKVLK